MPNYLNNKIKNHFIKVISFTFFFIVFLYSFWSCKIYNTNDPKAIKAKVIEPLKPIISINNKGNKTGGNNSLKDVYVENGFVYFSLYNINIQNLEKSSNITYHNVFLGTGAPINGLPPQDFLIKDKRLNISKNQSLEFKYDNKNTDKEAYEIIHLIPNKIQKNRYDGYIDGLKDRLKWRKDVNKELYLSLSYNSGNISNIVGGFNKNQNDPSIMKPITIFPKIIKEARKKMCFKVEPTENNIGNSIYIGEILKASSSTRVGSDKIVKIPITINIKLGNKFFKDLNARKNKYLYIACSKELKDLDGNEIDTKQILINAIKQAYRNSESKKRLISGYKNLKNEDSFKSTGDLKDDYDIYYNNNTILIPIKTDSITKNSFNIEFEINQSRLPSDLRGIFSSRLAFIDKFTISHDSKNLTVPVINYSKSRKLKIKGRYVALYINRDNKDLIQQKANNYKYVKQESLAVEFNGLFIYDHIKDSNTETLGASEFTMNCPNKVKMEYDGIDNNESVYPFWIIIRQDKIDAFINEYGKIEEKTKEFIKYIKNENKIDKNKPYYISKESHPKIKFEGKNIKQVSIQDKHIILSGGKMTFENAIKFFTENDKFSFSYDQMDNKGLKGKTSKFNILHKFGEEDINSEKTKNYYIIPAIAIKDASDEGIDDINIEKAGVFFLDYDTNNTYTSLKEKAITNKTLNEDLKQSLINNKIYLAIYPFQGNIGGSKVYKTKYFKNQAPQENNNINIAKRDIIYHFIDENINNKFTNKNDRNIEYFYGVNVAEHPSKIIRKYLDLIIDQQDLCASGPNGGLYSLDLKNKLEMKPENHGPSCNINELAKKINVHNAGRGMLLLPPKKDNNFKIDLKFDVDKTTNVSDPTAKAKDILQDPCRQFLDTNSMKTEPEWLKGIGEINAYDAKDRETPFETTVPPALRIAFSSYKNKLINSTAIGWSKAYENLCTFKKSKFSFTLPSKDPKNPIIPFPTKDNAIIQYNVKKKIFEHADFKIKFNHGNQQVEVDSLKNIFLFWKGNLYESLTSKILSIDKIDKNDTFTNITYNSQDINLKNDQFSASSYKILDPNKTITPKMLLYLAKFSTIFALLIKNIDKDLILKTVNEQIDKEENDIDPQIKDEYKNIIKKVKIQFLEKIYLNTVDNDGNKKTDKIVVFNNNGNMAYDGSFGYSTIDSNGNITHSKNIPAGSGLANRYLKSNDGKIILPNVCMLHKDDYLKLLEAKKNNQLEKYKDIKGIVEGGEVVVCFDKSNNNLPKGYKDWEILKNMVIISLTKNINNPNVIVL